jgi:tetratricopeptide (TPR) repeat protein
MTLTAGSHFGPYDILSPLGAGGFGEVYKARDTRLDRIVAIKILPSADPELKARFEREAKAIAALTHPHICRLYDVGHQQGIDYLVMEYLEGETLAQRLARGRLGTTDALRIAAEIADAIANAHNERVIHRDLKPANVMLTPHGVKLLDFGLAKLRAAAGMTPASIASTQRTPVTTEGTVLGTLHYMAPEQLEGRDADERSDIWAYGCLLYEMFTGLPLFDAPRMRRIAVRPRRVARVISKCVEPNPALRWPSMPAVQQELARRHRVSRRVVLTASAIAAALLLVIGVSRVRHPGVPAGLASPRTVLVADFRNSTGEAVFDGVIDRAVSVALESSPFINVYPRRDALASAAQIGHAAGLDETMSRLVSRREGVPTFVTGGISKASDGYGLSAAVIETVTGTPVAVVTEKSIQKAKVLDAVAKLAEKLRSAIGDTGVAGTGELARETFTTSSVDAAKAYATAQDLNLAGKDEDAIAYYQEAVRIDPEFGRAYAGWALSVDRMGRGDEAAVLFQKAISLLSRMNRRERLRTEGLYASRARQDYAEGDRIYSTLVAEYPADVTGLNNLAVCKFMLMRFEEAFEKGRAAVEMSPNYVLARTNLALYAMYAGRFNDAIAQAKDALRLNDKVTKAYVPLGIIATIQSNDADAAGWYDKMRGTSTQGAWLSELALADLDIVRHRFRSAEQRLLARAAEDATVRNTTAAAHSYAFLAELAARERRIADVERFAARGRSLSTDPHFAYRYATAMLDVNRDGGALRLLDELKQSRNAQAINYAMMLNAELAFVTAGSGSDLLETAKKVGTWWAFYRAGVVLSRARNAQAQEALRWCREHRAQGTAAFLNDVPTLRYYFAIDEME